MKTKSINDIEGMKYNPPQYYDECIRKMRHGIEIPESPKMVKCPKWFCIQHNIC